MGKRIGKELLFGLSFFLTAILLGCGVLAAGSYFFPQIQGEIGQWMTGLFSDKTLQGLGIALVNYASPQGFLMLLSFLCSVIGIFSFGLYGALLLSAKDNLCEGMPGGRQLLTAKLLAAAIYYLLYHMVSYVLYYYFAAPRLEKFGTIQDALLEDNWLAILLYTFLSFSVGLLMSALFQKKWVKATSLFVAAALTIACGMIPEYADGLAFMKHLALFRVLDYHTILNTGLTTFQLVLVPVLSLCILYGAAILFLEKNWGSKNTKETLNKEMTKNSENMF